MNKLALIVVIALILVLGYIDHGTHEDEAQAGFYEYINY